MNRFVTWGLALSLWPCLFASSSLAAERHSKEIDFARFKEALGDSAEDVKKQVGEPAARYTVDGVEHWLYDNSAREIDGLKLCPELLIKNGKCFQMNSVPREKMEKAVRIVKGFGNWTPPREVKQKGFTMADTGVVDRTKGEVVKKFGQPDVKRAFDGREVWEYRKVPTSKTDPRQLTLYLEFEGDKVSGSSGN